jgi:hypothetical protein
MKLVRLIKIYINETCIKVHTGKNLSDAVPNQNGLKQGDALSTLLFSFTLEYAIRKVQENQGEQEYNGSHQVLGYVGFVNILRANTNTTRKNTGALLEASRDVVLK